MVDEKEEEREKNKSVTFDTNDTDNWVTKVTNETFNEEQVEDFSQKMMDDIKDPNKNRREKAIKTMLPVSNVTFDTNDKVTNETKVTKREIETNETKETSNTKIDSSIFGSGNLGCILYLFYKSKDPKSYDEIADNINNDKAQIKVVINRNKEYFQEAKKEGKTKFFKLSNLGEQFVKEKIEQYKIAQEYLKKKEARGFELEKKLEELLTESKGFFNYYKRNLGEQIRMGRKSICVDFNDLSSYSPILSEALINDPLKILEVFETALEELGLTKNTQIRVKNLPKSSTLAVEQVRVEHLNQIIQIEGRSAVISANRGKIMNIKFECPSCGTLISVPQIGDSIKEPSRCSCGRKGGFRSISKNLVNSVRLILEDLQEKSTTINLQRLDCVIQDYYLTKTENLLVFSPGNEVRLVGILKESPIFRRGKISRDVGFEFEVLHAELLKPEIEAENLPKERVEDIIGLQSRIDEFGFGEIITSFSPDVYGYEEIKGALILQACAPKNIPGKKIRNKPNILMMGDPGVSKTVLGDFVISITPHSKKAVGGGSSAVGITASLTPVEESLGGYKLEAGALVLAKEILFLDELNNLSQDDKPKLQQGMADQRITIHKGNIHAELGVTAGTLAAANPKEGFFQEGKNVYQFNIPPAILDRFDLIFVMRDEINESEDEKIAEIMLRRERNQIKPRYPIEFLKDFFIYVRSQPEPKLTEVIEEKIKKIYTNFRKNEESELRLRPRFLESFIRFVKSSARVRGSEKIEMKDINWVFEIFSKSQYAMDKQKFFDIDKTKSKLGYERGLEIK